MSGQKLLLLLTVFVHLTRCQQMPKVSMSPVLKEIFSGDLFYLSCDNSASPVKWYFNDTEQSQLTDKTWKVAVASPTHSGSYQCESKGQKSDTFSINVLEFSPTASLTINTGHPVMHTGHAVILQLDNEEGLHGWRCSIYRRANEQRKTIKFQLTSNTTAAIQTTKLTAPETIFWCTDSTQNYRSNQIIVRTSDNDVALEMYPLPAVVGERLTLKCLVWGTDQISNTIFYKDNNTVRDSTSTLVIPKVTEVTQGRYKCEATYMHKARISGPPYHKTSDTQDVLVQAAPVKAVLSADNALSCSCPRCHRDFSYQWFYTSDGQPWTSMASTSDQMTPKTSGTYACRAVWNNRKSLLSNTYIYESSSPNLLLFFFIFLALLTAVLISLAVAYRCYRKSHSSVPVYEDVPLRLKNDGEKYETLQRDHGREAEYDSLTKGQEGREAKEGHYQPLKKEEAKEGVYHTLGPEEATGGQGGYEALKKEGMKEGVYETLGAEGETGGQGGYEALKKEGMKEGVYHTLSMDSRGKEAKD